MRDERHGEGSRLTKRIGEFAALWFWLSDYILDGKDQDVSGNRWCNGVEQHRMRKRSHGQPGIHQRAQFDRGAIRQVVFLFRSAETLGGNRLGSGFHGEEFDASSVRGGGNPYTDTVHGHERVFNPLRLLRNQHAVVPRLGSRFDAVR